MFQVYKDGKFTNKGKVEIELVFNMRTGNSFKAITRVLWEDEKGELSIIYRKKRCLVGIKYDDGSYRANYPRF